ncbi:metallophosphoesterase [Candidatus Woesearchaeota archaeon]|nr:metallophosphoesterase [Candidatus Woesearchaeota archaeon]
MKHQETTITQPENKQEHLVTKLIMFITLYLLLNYFIISEIYYFLEIPKNTWFSIILIIMSFSYVLGAAAIRYSNNVLAKTINIIGSTWLGIVAIAFIILVLVELLLFLKIIIPEQRIILTFITITAITIYALINATYTHKKTINITTNKIKKPITLIQVSDIHIGATHKKNFLERIIQKINEEKPDITVITGDLIDGKHKYEKNYFDVLRKIKSETYMVLGNHEEMTGIKTVKELLRKSNIKILENQKIKKQEINIIGINDTDKKRKMILELNKINTNPKEYNVLLFHRPIGFKQARKKIDLMLTGHTHAGQIFPLNLILRFFYKKIKGLKKKQNSYLYVSPGTGWWGPPMRLGSKNEITIFKIKPEQK